MIASVLLQTTHAQNITTSVRQQELLQAAASGYGVSVETAPSVVVEKSFFMYIIYAFCDYTNNRYQKSTMLYFATLSLKVCVLIYQVYMLKIRCHLLYRTIKASALSR